MQFVSLFHDAHILLKNLHKNDKMINIKATSTLAQLLAQLAPLNATRKIRNNG